nr:hypothetical protein Iba_chr03eCG2220 [Ipomoea batatas]
MISNVLGGNILEAQRGTFHSYERRVLWYCNGAIPSCTFLGVDRKEVPLCPPHYTTMDPLHSTVLVDAALTKEGKRSTALSRELMIGHGSCCGNRGAISVGRNGSFKARPCGARNKEMARIVIRKRDLERTAMAGGEERYDDEEARRSAFYRRLSSRLSVYFLLHPRNSDDESQNVVQDSPSNVG